MELKLPPLLNLHCSLLEVLVVRTAQNRPDGLDDFSYWKFQHLFGVRTDLSSLATGSFKLSLGVRTRFL